MANDIGSRQSQARAESARVRAHVDELSLYRASLITLSILVFFLISLGGLVRNMGAGLSCPDWPLCFGRFLPQFDSQIFVEYFHRVTAGLVSILNVAIVYLTFRNPQFKERLKTLAIVSLVILFSQVILGGLTVIHLLRGEIVTLHLATGTFYFITLLWMTKRALDLDKPWVTKQENLKLKSVWRWNVAALLTLVCQMIVGGVTSSHHAGLACPDFPTCLGEWWPGFDGLVAIHLTHRMGALLTACVFLTFLAKGSLTKGIENPRFKWILFFLCCQILLGIGNVIFRIPVSVGVLHLAIAQTLVALTFMSAYEIYHQKLR